jgi:hypothetical protein
MPSTVIRAFHYDPPTGRLIIEFRSGRRYVYSDVPLEEFTSLQNARSKGSYFNTRIRDHYAFVELDE